MTAPEPTPTAEHIDAVARVSHCCEPQWDDDAGWVCNPHTSDVTHRFEPLYCDAQVGATHRLLTSTDPAVHAAMLAALVRAGVLTVDLITLSDGYAGRLVTDFGSADLGQSEVAP